MNQNEARTECERWFASLDRPRHKSIELQKIASLRRSGEIDQAEGLMTNADIRASIAMQIAAGHSKIKIPLKDLKRLLAESDRIACHRTRATTS